MSLLTIGAIMALAIGIFVGYDAERWHQPVNRWSLVGVLLNVPGLVLWLVIRHAEAGRRRLAGQPAPPTFLRWVRRRGRHA
jgi:hypothetical protein